MADPGFGMVGLAILPLCFFYISTKLSENYRPFVIFFFSLGILSMFLSIVTIAENVTNTGVQNGLYFLSYSLIALWILYLVFELMNISIISLVTSLQHWGKKE